MTRRRLKGTVILLAWVAATLACNMPIGQNPQTASDEALRATMQALIFATPLAQPGGPVVTSPAATPFPGLQTATPLPIFITPVAPPPTQPPVIQPAPGFLIYYALAGDTLTGLAGRFSVDPAAIAYALDPSQPLPVEGYIAPGAPLSIPLTMESSPYPDALFPDSEVVNSPTAAGFSVRDYAASTGGYLSGYGEMVNGTWLSGADIVEKTALETSTNPRLLLAFLELRSGWVLGQPQPGSDTSHPIGFYVDNYVGLYDELSLSAKQLNIAYYSWRAGTLPYIEFPRGDNLRLSPGLNAGSTALQYLFSTLYDRELWSSLLYGPENFVSLYASMFGDPWQRAAAVEPLLPAGLAQPALELPFSVGESWRFTGGPHPAWNTGAPPGALDFAPLTDEPRCAVSSKWVTAVAPGVIIRTGDGVVMLDLDGDGYEQTGWAILYLHVAEYERIPAGVWVNTNDPIGHPSCEGGIATGKHVHMARKYNGEWIFADGPLPWVLSGWEAHYGGKAYQGSLTRGAESAIANPGGTRDTMVYR